MAYSIILTLNFIYYMYEYFLAVVACWYHWPRVIGLFLLHVI